VGLRLSAYEKLVREHSFAVLRAAAEKYDRQMMAEIAAYRARECWVCGRLCEARNCKLVCPCCGFTRSCEDP
jgi:rubrerythrin